MLPYTLLGNTSTNSTALPVFFVFSQLQHPMWHRGHEKKITKVEIEKEKLKKRRMSGFWKTSTNSLSLWGLWDVTVWQLETSGVMLPIMLQEMKYRLSGTTHEGPQWPDVNSAFPVCLRVCIDKLMVSYRHGHILNESFLYICAVKI